MQNIPEIFKKRPILIGAIHLPQFINSELAGTYTYQQIEDYVVENARIFQDGGFDGVFIQDQTPGRETSYQTIAWTAALARTARLAAPEIEIGIIIQSDDPAASLAIASAAGATFIRLKVYVGAMIKAGGIHEGCAARAQKARSDLYSDTGIFSDIYDRTGDPLGNIPIEKAAQHAVIRGSNGLILTGKDFQESLEYLRRVREAMKNKEIPLLIGGGVNEENVQEALSVADGAIVSSSLKKDSGPGWDQNKIRSLVELVNANSK